MPLTIARFSLLAALLPLAACEMTPSHVEASDIDDALIRDRFATVCVGLEMKDEDVRRYAAEKLQEVRDPMAAECVCKALPHETRGWDSAVANGLRTTSRDDLAGCFAELVKRPDLPKRVEAVVVLGTMSAPAARSALAAVAGETGAAPEVRAKAVEALAGDPESAALLASILDSDADPSVRLAAAAGLEIKKNKVAKAALRKASSDSDGAVRGTALVGLKKIGASDADELLCTAMLEDESPEVRVRAVGAYRGTRRSSAIACLRKKALSREDDAGVRTKLIEVLKSSPKDEAAAVLCDAIPFFARSYLDRAMPDKVPGTDIIKAQNDRDFENSYACVEKAVRAGGYSCFGKAYVGHWFRELGGSTHVPRCPGYE